MSTGCVEGRQTGRCSPSDAPEKSSTQTSEGKEPQCERQAALEPKWRTGHAMLIPPCRPGGVYATRILYTHRCAPLITICIVAHRAHPPTLRWRLIQCLVLKGHEPMHQVMTMTGERSGVLRLAIHGRAPRLRHSLQKLASHLALPVRSTDQVTCPQAPHSHSTIG